LLQLIRTQISTTSFPYTTLFRSKTAYFETARITQEVSEKGNRLEIGTMGGFEADYIIGLDKKTPVVVENNTSWNIPKSIKGKTKDRKSTRLNSSHQIISYAVFCL